MHMRDVKGAAQLSMAAALLSMAAALPLSAGEPPPVPAQAAASAARPLQPDDWYRFREVSDVQLAPDGQSAAYLVTRYDKDSDESRADLWTVSWSGGDARQLTHGEGVDTPRFSPDGRYLGFLSARPAESRKQLWLLDRRGGEARQLGQVQGEISDYVWSPDGSRLVLAVNNAAEEKTPQPIVIDALQFKNDIEGYRRAGSHTALWMLDVTTGALTPLTKTPDRDASAPAFSPDGKQIAYVSNRLADEGIGGQNEIWLVDAAGSGEPRKLLAAYAPNRQRLYFSPDGRQLALLVGDAPPVSAYMTDRLAVADVSNGSMRVLTDKLDRAVLLFGFVNEGEALRVLVEDDGYQYPADVAVDTGALTRLGEHMVLGEIASQGERAVVVSGSDTRPLEVQALEHGKLRALTHHNDELFSGLALGTVEDLSFRSGDGTEVHGQLVKPPGYVAGHRYPTIVWIHGGPNGQDDHAIDVAPYGPPLERQLFASHGYVVLAINYRGSTGRGSAFARSIRADWGHHEVEDLRAGVDAVIARGIADPNRLGIGGWSYGGILTDYTIASDRRFRAAISGAGSANQLSMYGADQYVMQYNAELGPPWRHPELWNKVSYPFFHADRIHTPTLFMGGDKDFNVPIAGGEQMYQALRTLGVPAELVIYPGEFHVFSRPSFLVDRWLRFLGWMDKYLAPEPAAGGARD